MSECEVFELAAAPDRTSRAGWKRMRAITDELGENNEQVKRLIPMIGARARARARRCFKNSHLPPIAEIKYNRRFPRLTFNFASLARTMAIRFRYSPFNFSLRYLDVTIRKARNYKWYTIIAYRKKKIPSRMKYLACGFWKYVYADDGDACACTVGSSTICPLRADFHNR